jgi:hypothetical protein
MSLKNKQHVLYEFIEKGLMSLHTLVGLSNIWGEVVTKAFQKNKTNKVAEVSVSALVFFWQHWDLNSHHQL